MPGPAARPIAGDTAKRSIGSCRVRVDGMRVLLVGGRNMGRRDGRLSEIGRAAEAADVGLSMAANAFALQTERHRNECKSAQWRKSASNGVFRTGAGTR